MTSSPERFRWRPRWNSTRRAQNSRSAANDLIDGGRTSYFVVSTRPVIPGIHDDHDRWVRPAVTGRWQALPQGSFPVAPRASDRNLSGPAPIPPSLSPPGYGRDAAATVPVDPDSLLIVKSDPITFATDSAAQLPDRGERQRHLMPWWRSEVDFGGSALAGTCYDRSVGRSAVCRPPGRRRRGRSFRDRWTYRGHLCRDPPGIHRHDAGHGRTGGILTPGGAQPGDDPIPHPIRRD